MAVRVGDILKTVIERAEKLSSFQHRLNDMATDAARKQAIIAAVSDGFITREDAELLIQSYGLEGA